MDNGMGAEESEALDPSTLLDPASDPMRRINEAFSPADVKPPIKDIGTPPEEYAELLDVSVTEDELKSSAGKVLQSLFQEYLDELGEMSPTGDDNEDLENAVDLLESKERKWKQIAFILVGKNSNAILEPASFRLHVQRTMPDLWQVWRRVKKIIDIAPQPS